MSANVVLDLLKLFGVKDFTAADSFKLTNTLGVMEILVHRTNGVTERMVKYIPDGKGFDDMVPFKPLSLSTSERAALVRKLHHAQMAQAHLAVLFECPQSTISKYLNSREK